MFKKIMMMLVVLAGMAAGCSDSADPLPDDVDLGGFDSSVLDDQGRDSDLDSKPDGLDAGDSGMSQDMGTDTQEDMADQDMATDMADQDNDMADQDSDMAADMTDQDMTDQDMAADMADQDMANEDMNSGPPPYDTTGWTMKSATHSDSASTGTPDSYFYSVDSGSPLSASISGGGSGFWTVNVFGGYSNHLYCTGTSLCRVMLRPEDTTVIITAVTTGIGPYTLSIQYSGAGKQ